MVLGTGVVVSMRVHGHGHCASWYARRILPLWLTSPRTCSNARPRRVLADIDARGRVLADRLEHPMA
jgi:hypothetical protein